MQFIGHERLNFALL